jgi:hypothetical protein
MQTGARSVEDRGSDAPATDGLDGENLPTATVEYERFQEEEPTASGAQRLVTVLLIAAALAWIGVAAWRGWLALSDGRPDLPAVLQGVATLSAPLALIGIVWLLMLRTSRREAGRFARTAAAMRAEAAQLEHVLGTLSSQIAENRRELADHAHQLLLLGDDATNRMTDISTAMRGQSGEIAQQSDRLEQAARAARDDMSVLLQDLPRATGESREMAALLKGSGLAAHEQTAALAAALASVTQRGREAEETAGGAAQRLAAHLARIEGTTNVAGERLEAAAGQMGGMVDAALAKAAGAVDEARRGIEAQSAAMLAMAEQARVALEQAGAESARTLAGRLDEIGARMDALAAQLASQAAAGSAMVETLGSGIAGVADRFDALERTGGERTAALGSALATLGQSAERIDATLDQGVQTADALVARAESLGGMLRESGDDLQVILPRAIEQLERRVAESHVALGALVPQAAKLAASADDAAAKLGGADAMLMRQATTMRELGLAAEERLEAIREHAGELDAAISGSGDRIRQLVDGAGPQLIDSLLRVRETAMQAADHARDAFARVIPDVAGTLRGAAEDAFAHAIDGGIETQMAEIAASSERAVQAAQHATERLMRQMLTIADTTAGIEARIAEARADAEEADDETFARRVTALIDQLNSTAINVTGMLSQEVSDSAWASYLKGDRGIFTRRAVRLLDSTEVREIQRLYERDAGFRDQLNRYVHDFEAMLRRVLASREGGTLGVTLLSSDMGKLYVALAQAIERLRT